MNREFKGVWIPKEIWLSKELTLQEKVFIVEIDSLDNAEGCFASNAYFAEFFDLSKNRCSEVIKSLEKKGMIIVTYIREVGKRSIEKRIIHVVGKSNRVEDEGIRKTEQGIREIDKGYSEKCEDNNTINNTINNIEEDKPLPSKKKDNLISYDELGLVKLTKEQYDKLCSDYNIEFVTNLIENMSLYLGQNNKKPYKNSYLALLKWAKNSKYKPQQYDMDSEEYKREVFGEKISYVFDPTTRTRITKEYAIQHNIDYIEV